VCALSAAPAEALLAAVEPQLQSANPSDLSILLYSVAILGYRPSLSWLQAHGRAVRGLLHDLGVRRISNLLWAHAKLGMRPTADKLLGDMVSALHGGLHEANTRDLASTLWALATLGFLPQRGFLEAFGAQVRNSKPCARRNHSSLGCTPCNLVPNFAREIVIIMGVHGTLLTGQSPWPLAAHGHGFDSFICREPCS
jgi:hypothetical protein